MDRSWIQTVTLLFLFFFLLTVKSYAIVDYTDQDEAFSVPLPSQSSNLKKSSPSVVSKRSRPTTTNQSVGGRQWFHLDYRYESLDVKNEQLQGEGKVVFHKLNGHFQTPYHLYLNLSYWAALSPSQDLSSSRDVQQGNPSVVLGINWLDFGSQMGMAQVDLVFGTSLKGNNSSSFAHHRNDQWVGLETSKGIGLLTIALGYEFRITGASQVLTELDVGNIQKFSAAMSLRATPDIAFVLEGQAYRLEQGDETKAQYLKEKISAASITAKLGLTLSPSIVLDLGGVFQSNRPKSSEELIGAKLWDLTGLYGNSLFAQLGFSL